MKARPLVSIIIPTLNRAYILPTAIKSVLAQSDPRWELVVVDDGSTDGTAELVKSLSDERIRYFYQDHAGPCVARNLGVREARGDWIAYLDSDNELAPKYVETMLAHFAKHPKATYGLPMGNYRLELYENGQLVETIDQQRQFPAKVTILDVFHRRVRFDINGFMHARSLFDGGIQFDPKLGSLEDWDLILQMGNRYPKNFLFVPEVLYSYFQRYGLDGRFAATGYEGFARKYEAIYRKHQHDKLMRGQAWYPKLVNEWHQREEEFQAGKLPPSYLYQFPNHWPARLRPQH